MNCTAQYRGSPIPAGAPVRQGAGGCASAAWVDSTAAWSAARMSAVVRRPDHVSLPRSGRLAWCSQNAGQNPPADILAKDPDAIDSSGECSFDPDLRVRPSAGT